MCFPNVLTLASRLGTLATKYGSFLHIRFDTHFILKFIRVKRSLFLTILQFYSPFLEDIYSLYRTYIETRYHLVSIDC